MQAFVEQVASIPVENASEPNQSVKALGEEYFYVRLQHIWSKVMLLEQTGFIQNENDKFQYAYRLAEVELQKLCTDYAALEKSRQEK